NLFGAEARSVWIALTGLSTNLELNPGLTPWAGLLGPFGVLIYEPFVACHGISGSSAMPIFERRYRKALRDNPRSRAAWLLFPPERRSASRIISSSHWSSVMPGGRKPIGALLPFAGPVSRWMSPASIQIGRASCRERG